MKFHSRFYLRSTAAVTLATVLWLLAIPLFGVHVHSGGSLVVPVIHAHDKKIAHDAGAPEIPKNGMPTSPSDLLFSGKLKKDDPSTRRVWDLAHAIIPLAEWMSPNATYSDHVYSLATFVLSRFATRFRSIRAPPTLI